MVSRISQPEDRVSLQRSRERTHTRLLHDSSKRCMLRPGHVQLKLVQAVTKARGAGVGVELSCLSYTHL